MTNEAYKTILAQLGGNKFLVMTGAKNMTHSEDGTRLAFKLPRNFAKDGINYVSVKLEADDTYSLTFNKITGLNVKEVSAFDFVYADDLRYLFTVTTGLNVSL